MRIQSKMWAFFIAQFAAGWMYELWDASSSTDGQEVGAARVVGSLTNAIGSVVPKAAWYASYFRENGNQALAGQLVRVYGFCLVLFLVATLWLIIRAMFPTGPRLRREHRFAVDRDSARADQLAVAAVALVLAYFDFIGFGLQPGGRFQIELTSGANVIGAPIFGFPILFALLLYLLRDRIAARREG